MKLRVSHFIILNFLLISLAGLIPAQSNDDDPKYAQETAVESQKRIDDIKAELRNLKDHAWAGEYYYGDGLGVNVTLYIAPRGGFVFEWSGCMGLYDRNFGAVSQDGSLLKLLPKFPNDRGGFQGIALEFFSVGWGPRHYLIASDEVIQFCNAVNAAMEPWHGIGGQFLLKRDDAKKDVSGMPGIPEKYLPYLLSKPIEAKIVAIGAVETKQDGDFTRSRTAVTLNAGRDQGLLPEMKLYVVSLGDTMTGLIKVVKADAAQSEAYIYQNSKYDKPPQLLWTLSTCFPAAVAMRDDMRRSQLSAGAKSK